jgi:MFS family permease
MEDAAWVNSVIPLADVVGPPVAGIVADKLGNFRLFMAAVTFLNGAAALLLLAIPRLHANKHY